MSGIPVDYKFNAKCMIDAVWELSREYPLDSELQLIKNDLLVSTSETVDWLLRNDNPVSFAEAAIRQRFLHLQRVRTDVVPAKVHHLRKPY